MSCKLSHIQFRYPTTSKNILDVVDFEIKKNEKVFLFGPSGCGKTTFLETIAGILVPQKGTLEVCGSEITKLSQKRTYSQSH